MATIETSAHKWTRHWRFRRNCSLARLGVEVGRTAAQRLLAQSAAETHLDHAAIARVERAVEAEVPELW
jgi:hypothetical protein